MVADRVFILLMCLIATSPWPSSSSSPQLFRVFGKPSPQMRQGLSTQMYRVTYLGASVCSVVMENTQEAQMCPQPGGAEVSRVAYALPAWELMVFKAWMSHTSRAPEASAPCLCV